MNIVIKRRKWESPPTTQEEDAMNKEQGRFLKLDLKHNKEDNNNEHFLSQELRKVER